MGASTIRDMAGRLSLSIAIGLIAAGLIGAPGTWAADDAYTADRAEMVDLIRTQIADVIRTITSPQATTAKISSTR